MTWNKDAINDDPIAEELTVRGLLMGYIEKKANITFAIIVTSVLFALVHFRHTVQYTSDRATYD
jgi:membrane protease YdiL (CAAX protease family)